jgi:uncharacterized membrane protein (DUF373 family)
VLKYAGLISAANPERNIMFEKRLLTGLNGFNRFLHVLLALAMGIASVMVILDFGSSAISAWHGGNAAQGFFHALGSLFVLWTLSTLISAEITYVQTGRVYVRVFVEVAMISVIREMIIQPVQVITNPGTGQVAQIFNPLHYGLLLGGLLISGIVYRLVTSSPVGQESAPILDDKA